MATTLPVLMAMPTSAAVGDGAVAGTVSHAVPVPVAGRGKPVLDVDYTVAGIALLVGVGLAASVTMLSLLRTGRVPNAVTVVALMLGCAVLVLGVVETVVPH